MKVVKIDKIEIQDPWKGCGCRSKDDYNEYLRRVL
jgi:hypothetical protein